MPNIDLAFPSRYLRVADLQGRDCTVTIRIVVFEPVGGRREPKAIAYFVGKQKGIILNRTNARTIVAIAGSSLTEAWVGIAITLYPTRTTFQGSPVDCIRIRPAGTSA